MPNSRRRTLGSATSRWPTRVDAPMFSSSPGRRSCITIPIKRLSIVRRGLVNNCSSSWLECDTKWGLSVERRPSGWYRNAFGCRRRCMRFSFFYRDKGTADGIVETLFQVHPRLQIQDSHRVCRGGPVCPSLNIVTCVFGQTHRSAPTWLSTIGECLFSSFLELRLRY